MDWPDGHRAERVREADVDIELVLESGSAVMLSWEVNGLDESLAIELRDPAAVAGTSRESLSMSVTIRIGSHLSGR
ncbi:hypothetical protein [Actinopolyspora mzabensis]|uniref:hypothetical protein n=1 Tax=Actinopolyspora mzabensis TaxID=995066 RepID=UPI00115FCA68|nr:hypothetical protein [Actinopolyspora mzabensis]